MTNYSSTPPDRPASATSVRVALCGVIAFLAAILLVRFVHPAADIAYAALFVMAATALGVFVPDMLWQKVHLRMREGRETGLDPSWQRTFIKFAGLLGSVGFVALAYYLFPEYHGAFYSSYNIMLAVMLPPALLLAIPYIQWVDARMAEPEDGLWHTGCLVTFQWRALDWMRMWQHLLGWVVKGFFLPLMFTYMCSDLSRFIAADFGNFHTFKSWYDFFFDLFYFVDVGICSCGYLFAMRLTDTHIRSTEPTLFGWGIALLCYEPFWSLIGRQYLAYEPGKVWGDWMIFQPVLYGFWGTVILILTLIYVWATVMFGMRFSNLTHRGIITSGPYRWSKHPAYIAKNLSWWLISMPFLVNVSVSETLRHSGLLLLLNLVYFLRAKTEERHLSRDPVYVQYAAWVNENGLLGKLKRCGMKLGFIPHHLPLGTNLR